MAGSRSGLVDALARLRRGEGSLESLAEALRSHAGGIHPLPPADDSKPLGFAQPDDSYIASVFSHEDLARACLADSLLCESGKPVPHAAQRWSAVFQEAVLQKWAGIIIDEGSNHMVTLERAAVEQLARLVGSGAASAPAPTAPSNPPDASRAVAPGGAKCPSADTPSRRHFRTWMHRAEQRQVKPWQFLEAIAFEMEWFVAQGAATQAGGPWPVVEPHPGAAGKTLARAYTSQGDGRGAALRGVEALRWIWAAPGEAHEIGLDYPDAGGWMTLPSSWALQTLLPLAQPNPGLAHILVTPLSKLGALPGARGTKPEIVRALVCGWKQLVGVGAAPGDSIVQGNVRLRPVFSSMESFVEGTRSSLEISGKPESPGTSPPFAHWLEGAQEWDGVVMDPAGPAPLVLGLSDLLILDLWSRAPVRQPTPSDVVARLAELVANRRLAPRLAARIAADMPRYWVGVPAHTELGSVLLQLPNSRTAAIFTRLERARGFVETHAPGGRHHGMVPAEVPTRWRANALRSAAESSEDAWIDPSPNGTGGLHLSREDLLAALERLDETLRPRIPGFEGAP